MKNTFSTVKGPKGILKSKLKKSGQKRRSRKSSRKIHGTLPRAQSPPEKIITWFHLKRSEYSRTLRMPTTLRPMKRLKKS